MQAHVYKSLRKPDTYLFLAEREGVACLPAPVREALGRLQFVMELEITPERRLARSDAATVRANLVARGFHLQVPEGQVDDPMTDDWGTDA